MSKMSIAMASISYTIALNSFVIVLIRDLTSRVMFLKVI